VGETEARSQLILVFDSIKLAWIFGIAFAAFAAGNSPVVAAVIAVASLMLAAVSLKPVRLRTTDTGASLGVLRRWRWEWWSSEQVAVIQYAHWPGMFRGTARLRFQTVDGTKVTLPGTVGRMLWRTPDLQRSPNLTSARVRVVGAVAFLRLVRYSFDRPIETEGAEWFSPAQPT
jgi:hypothetical protein